MSRTRTRRVAGVLWPLFLLAAVGGASAGAQDPVPAQLTPDEPATQEPTTPEATPPEPEDLEGKGDMPPIRARQALDLTLGYLLAQQNEDGSWGVGVPDDLTELGFALDTFYAWNQASNSLVMLALLESPRTPERDAALEAGLEWLCSTRLAHRGSTWDVDSTWASLYGFVFLTKAAREERFAAEPWSALIEKRALEFYADLDKRQTPGGGWAYYDDPPITIKPTWATSFCTALILPALREARDELGWPIEDRVIDGAVSAVKRCSLPNGAFSYDVSPIQRSHGGQSINQVPGSLGRIQVCNWALSELGVERVTPDVLREGLENFFAYHSYLDMIRTHPTPHAGFFANAGYFYYFGHYYAAQAISLLPEGERELWHRRLRYHVIKNLTKEGSCTDFLTSRYVINACTAFTALVLAAGLPPEAGEAAR